MGFDVNASFARRSWSNLIKPGHMIKELPEKKIQFHVTFHGLKFQINQRKSDFGAINANLKLRIQC